jgi:hypothetical protein
LLFFDDDIVFEAARYQGRRHESHGAIILERAVDILEREPCAVVGCRYSGRADLSLTEHLAAYVGRLSLEAEHDRSSRAFRRHASYLLTYPKLPLVISGLAVTSDGEYEGPGGLSSGFLAMRAEQLPYAHFPNVYNEDWFWLAILARRRATLVQLEDQVLHAPEVCYRHSVERSFYQEVGEVLWNGLSGHMLPSSFGSGARQSVPSMDEVTSDLLCARDRRMLLIRNLVGEIDKMVARNSFDQIPSRAVVLKRLSDVVSDLTRLRSLLRGLRKEALVNVGMELVELVNAAPSMPSLVSWGRRAS